MKWTLPVHKQIILYLTITFLTQLIVQLQMVKSETLSLLNPIDVLLFVVPLPLQCLITFKALLNQDLSKGSLNI